MNKVEKMMKLLDLTEEEAIQLIADDKAIDKGEKKFELTKEQKQNAKKYTKVDKAVNAYGKEVKRTRKEDKEKQDIIKAIEKGLTSSGYYSFETTNNQKEIIMTVNGRRFKITLSAPRK